MQGEDAKASPRTWQHCILRAFLIDGLFFVIVLIIFTIYQYNLLAKREEDMQMAVNRIHDQHRCLKCCFDGTTSSHCTDCYDSLSICEKGKKYSRQKGQYTEEEIRKIVQDELEFMSTPPWAEKVVKRFESDEIFEKTRNQIEQIHSKQRRPAAHLTCKNQADHQSGDNLHMRSWQLVQGAGSTFTQANVTYDKEKGVLRIPRDGRYNIHLQTTFRTEDEQQLQEKQISHKVLLVEPETVLTEDSKWLDRECSGSKYEATLSSTVVQELSVNAELKVEISMPEHLALCTGGSKTYFDVVMI